ncbi:uncharacterized protein LOC119354173 [Triticum dicoccoides]|uniref:uncharacterized protein LOC119354173 n=1 Tax=Triticum dicoccoides TaxID=85692 RepID=UPI000E7AF11F|nr:uncharacterized protein LOC119354173 [Triticum dicoccoides]
MCKMRKPKKHLYIIFDDWELGFSIRKIDLDTDQLIPGGYKALEVALPAPSIRFRAKCSYPIYFSDAIGSKILAMHPKKENADRGAFCFDVHNRRLNCIPRHTDQFRSIYLPIGDKLFALGTSLWKSLTCSRWWA